MNRAYAITISLLLFLLGLGFGNGIFSYSNVEVLQNSRQNETALSFFNGKVLSINTQKKTVLIETDHIYNAGSKKMEVGYDDATIFSRATTLVTGGYVYGFQKLVPTDVSFIRPGDPVIVTRDIEVEEEIYALVMTVYDTGYAK